MNPFLNFYNQIYIVFLMFIWVCVNIWQNIKLQSLKYSVFIYFDDLNGIKVWDSLG